MSHWNELSEDEKYQVKSNMQQYGGHFASHLAMAWMFADSSNEKRLAETFPDLVERYHPKNWETQNA